MKPITLLSLTFLLVCFAFSSHADDKKPLIWQVKNLTWTKSFENSYEEFIATLGKAKKDGFCQTTNDCLKNAHANPKFYNLNPRDLANISSDCADLPYILRAYFSWMNDLPFSYPTSLSPSNLNVFSEIYGFNKDLSVNQEGRLASLFGGRRSRAKRDIRYNRFGNIIKEKRYIKTGDDINVILRDVKSAVSTATFRTNASNDTTSNLFRDTYPVDINKNAIKPGTILYDPNGHVAIVYEVTNTGKIHLIDAHPDNSLTAITYGEKFTRTKVDIGGGFSNWRPFSYVNGEATATPNEQLENYSLIQFQNDKIFIFDDRPMSFYEFVRNKLSAGDLIYKPVVEITELLEEICYDLKERNSAVNLSLLAGLQNQDHPSQLPDNIYGTDGDWETYSSPSRDARLKASVREGRDLIMKMIKGYKNADPAIQFDGTDIVRDLTEAYEHNVQTCVLDIKKTNGEMLSFNLKTILANIYKLSFDPYHCVELRWGLTDPESLASCGQSKEKLDWYNAEQGLRNYIDRDYTMQTGYDLLKLSGAAISNTIQENISLEQALQE